MDTDQNSDSELTAEVAERAEIDLFKQLFFAASSTSAVRQKPDAAVWHIICVHPWSFVVQPLGSDLRIRMCREAMNRVDQAPQLEGLG